MKKVFIIIALIMSFSGISQNRYRIKTGGGKITGAQIEDSLDVELAQVRWKAIEVPSGGTMGQVLEKVDGIDYNVQWSTPTIGTDDQTAAEVPITDTGSYFTGTDVESALQELGAGTSGGTAFIKKNIRIATTSNITLSGLQTIDGNLTAQGERVLVKNQSTPSENGIYIASSGSWVRSPEANTSQKLARTYVYVTSGSTMFDKFFLTDFDTSNTLGSDDVIFTETPFDLTTVPGPFNDSDPIAYKDGDATATLGFDISAAPSGERINLTVSDNIDLDAVAINAATVTLKENLSNKATTLDSPNDTKYPSTEAVAEAIGELNLLGEEDATTTRNAAITDADGLVNVNSATDVTITVQANATTAFAVGTVLSYFQENTGDVLIAYDGGVTGEAARTFGAGHKIVIWQTATDVWQVISRPATASVTSAEYAALSSALQNNGTAYFLTD